MFTGIIQAIGHIDTVEKLGDGFRLHINAGKLDMGDVQLGDSIALQGACMTVVSMTDSHFAIDISAESLDKTTGLDKPGHINLEKALRFNDRLGGHLVSGHVDGMGTVTVFEQVEQIKTNEYVSVSEKIESVSKQLAAWHNSQQKQKTTHLQGQSLQGLFALDERTD